MASRLGSTVLSRAAKAGPSFRPRGQLIRSVRIGASLVLVGGTAWAVTSYDPASLREAARQLKSPFLLHLDSAANPSAPDFRTDAATDLTFPLHLPLVSSTPSLTLVGLGVRTVSFLRVKVYSAGFYLEQSVTKRLDRIEGWHTFDATHLLVPPPPVTDPLKAPPQLSGEALMRNLVDQPISAAVRIVPVRNTDFSHLRDGFTRALQARQKLGRASGELSEADEQRISESMQALKSLFPAQKVPKGKSLVLLRTSRGDLVVEYEGKVLGQVQDRWLAREMLLAYFADKDVISPKLKEDVAHGLEAFMKR